MNLWKSKIIPSEGTLKGMATSGCSLLQPNLDSWQVNPLQEGTWVVDLLPLNKCKSLWFKRQQQSLSPQPIFLLSPRASFDPHTQRTRGQRHFITIVLAASRNLFLIRKNKSQPHCRFIWIGSMTMTLHADSFLVLKVVIKLAFT